MSEEVVQNSVGRPKKKSPFSNLKPPDSIIYQLIEKNDMSMRTDTQEYPPYIRKKNTDVINYKLPEDIKGLGSKDEVIQVAIRYIHGEKSIFVYEQEANGRVIPENILHNQKNDIEIIDGEIRIQPTEKTKRQFLDYVSWNMDSPYKSGRVKPIVRRLREEVVAAEETEKFETRKSAMEKAYAADEVFIAAHAELLHIPLIDHKTNGGRTYEAVRRDYLKLSETDSARFLETYDQVKQ